MFHVLNNRCTDQLQIDYPIIQAPMAGGITTTELVATVSNAGGLGSIGAGYMTPEKMREQIKEVKRATTKPFHVNLFVPNDFTTTEEEIKVAHQQLQPIREMLHMNDEINVDLSTTQAAIQTFHDQINVIIEEKVPICSFTFGIPSKEIIHQLKAHGIILIGTATSVTEAIENEKAGMDLVVVQGSEAGGHRGGFHKEEEQQLIGLMALIPQVVDQVHIPVIAAGGIMDGRGLVASLSLGAQAVQMGTAFLTCPESGAHELYKEAILQADEDNTVVTRAFSGKYARGLRNQFIAQMQQNEKSLPDFPIQNALTKEIRAAASLQRNREFMSLWMGQNAMLAQKQTAHQFVDNVVAEARRVITTMSM